MSDPLPQEWQGLVAQLEAAGVFGTPDAVGAAGVEEEDFATAFERSLPPPPRGSTAMGQILNPLLPEIPLPGGQFLGALPRPFRRGVAQGVVGTLGGVGALGQFAHIPGGAALADTMTRASQWITENYGADPAERAAWENAKGTLGRYGDPNYWWEQGGEALGSTGLLALSLIGTGGAGAVARGAGAAAWAGKVGMGATAAKVVGAAARAAPAAAMSRTVESLMEAGNSYAELRLSGKDEKAAGAAGASTFANNLTQMYPWDVAQLAVGIAGWERLASVLRAKAGQKQLTKAVLAGAGVAAAGLSEGLEELVQYDIAAVTAKRYAAGEGPMMDAAWLRALEDSIDDPQKMEAAILGIVMGLGFQGANAVTSEIGRMMRERPADADKIGKTYTEVQQSMAAQLGEAADEAQTPLAEAAPAPIVAGQAGALPPGAEGQPQPQQPGPLGTVGQAQAIPPAGAPAAAPAPAPAEPPGQSVPAVGSLRAAGAVAATTPRAQPPLPAAPPGAEGQPAPAAQPQPPATATPDYRDGWAWMFHRVNQTAVSEDARNAIAAKVAELAKKRHVSNDDWKALGALMGETMPKANRRQRQSFIDGASKAAPLPFTRRAAGPGWERHAPVAGEPAGNLPAQPPGAAGLPPPAAEPKKPKQVFRGKKLRPGELAGPPPPTPPDVTPAEQAALARPVVLEPEIGRSPRFDVLPGPKEKKKVGGFYAWLDAATALHSGVKGYPSIFQPRGNDVVRKAKVNEISLAPDIAQLGEGSHTAMGAPTVTQGGVVLVGNTRVQGLIDAYANGRGDTYLGPARQLAASLGLGEPADLGKMRAPVLVRVVTDYNGYSPRDIAHKGNQELMVKMAPAAQARQDALTISKDMLAKYRPDANGNVLAASNRDFLVDFLNATGHSDLIHGDSIGEDAQTIVQRAMLVLMVDRLPAELGVGERNALLDTLIQKAGDEGMQRPVKGVLAAAGQLLRAGTTRPAYDLTPHVSEALRQVLAFKQEGVPLATWKGQPDWQGNTPQTNILFDLLVAPGGAEAVAAPLREYARVVEAHDPSEKDMFGESKTPLELLEHILKPKGPGNAVPKQGAAAVGAQPGGREGAGGQGQGAGVGQREPGPAPAGAQAQAAPVPPQGEDELKLSAVSANTYQDAEGTTVVTGNAKTGLGRPAKHYTVEQLQKAIDTILKPAFGGGPSTKVTAVTQAELPLAVAEKLRRLQREQPKRDLFIRGVFHKGEIFLVAEGLGTPWDVIDTWIHENLHFGLRAAFGPKLDGILDEVADALGRVAREGDPNGLNNNAARREDAEEFLAHHASGTTEYGEWNVTPEQATTIWQKFRRWVRRLFRGRAQIRDDRLKEIVLAAQRATFGKEKKGIEKPDADARLSTGAAADDFLDLDKPLAEQSETVRAALARLGITRDPDADAGEEWVDLLDEQIKGQPPRHAFGNKARGRDASLVWYEQRRGELLASVGLQGLREFDKVDGEYHYTLAGKGGLTKLLPPATDTRLSVSPGEPLAEGAIESAAAKTSDAARVHTAINRVLDQIPTGARPGTVNFTAYAFLRRRLEQVRADFDAGKLDAQQALGEQAKALAATNKFMTTGQPPPRAFQDTTGDMFPDVKPTPAQGTLFALGGGEFDRAWDRARGKAMSGQQVGRPELANPAALGTLARPLMEGAQEVAKIYYEKVNFDEVREAARADIRERGEVQVYHTLLKKAKNGRLPFDMETTAYIQVLLEDASLDKVFGKNSKEAKEFAKLGTAYVLGGTDAGRALAIRRDLHLDPAERNEMWLKKALLMPSQRTRKAAESAKTDEDMERVYAMAEKEREAWAQAAAKNGIDLFSLSAADFADGQKMVRLIRAKQTATASLADMVYEGWINGLLSGVTTPAANTVGNTANMLIGAAVEGISATASALTGDTAPLKALPHALAGMMTALPVAWHAARLTWDTELPQLSQAIAPNDFTADKIENMHGVSIPGWGGRVARWPVRLMLATDEFYKQILWAAYLTKFAHEDAVRSTARGGQGLDGQAVEDYVRRQILNPASPASLRAYDEAKRLTFTDEPWAVVRAVSEMKHKDVSRISWYLLPFVRTPGNIFRAAFRLTPLALPAFGWSAKRHGLLAPETMRRGAEQVFGFALLAIIAGMLDDDDEKGPRITGSAPGKGRRAGQREFEYSTLPPNSIRLGDQWYSYGRIEPFATALSILVDGLNAVNMAEKGADQDAMFDQVSRGLKGILRDKTFIRSVSDIMQAMEEPKFLQSWAQNMASSVMPNIVKSGGRSADEYIRDYQIRYDPDKGFWSQLGWYTAHKTLPIGAVVEPPPARLNHWGQDVRAAATGVPSSFLFRLAVPARVQDTSTVAADYAIARWNEQHPNDVWYPTMPRAKVQYHGQEIEFTRDEWIAVAKEAGSLAKAKVERLTARGVIKAGEEPTAKTIAAIKDAFEDARATASRHGRIAAQKRLARTATASKP